MTKYIIGEILAPAGQLRIRTPLIKLCPHTPSKLLHLKKKTIKVLILAFEVNSLSSPYCTFLLILEPIFLTQFQLLQKKICVPSGILGIGYPVPPLFAPNYLIIP